MLISHLTPGISFTNTDYKILNELKYKFFENGEIEVCEVNSLMKGDYVTCVELIKSIEKLKELRLITNVYTASRDIMYAKLTMAGLDVVNSIRNYTELGDKDKVKLESIIELYLQAIFDAKEFKLEYAEVLLRPLDKTKSVADILYDFNGRDNRMELDLYIIGKSIEYLKELDEKIKLTINLSADTLKKRRVSEKIISLIGENKDRILLEISEDTDFTNKVVLENLEQLEFIGLALDDYGIGNTGIEILEELKVVMVKFDRVYVMGKKDTDLELIDKLNKQGIYTVIEGVETEDDLLNCRIQGYSHLQGFHLDIPRAFNEFKDIYNRL